MTWPTWDEIEDRDEQIKDLEEELAKWKQHAETFRRMYAEATSETREEALRKIEELSAQYT